MTKYVVFASFDGSVYMPICANKTPIITDNIRDCERAAEDIRVKNHLLPSQMDIIIFREINPDEYRSLERN